MAGPRGHLLLCFLALCLAGPSFFGEQKQSEDPLKTQVRSKRCDVKTKFVTHIPCTPCPAIKKRACPLGWTRAFPEKISQDCRCASPPSLASGVSCGVAGDQEGLAGLGKCPGGAETPCSGHGTCLDGIDGNGTCVCQENFGGSACQECRDPNRFGPDCQSELLACRALNCPRNSQCSEEAPSCSCLPGYTQQGHECRGLVSIAHDSSAGCFAHCSAFSCDRSATCQVTPDGKTSCVCKEGEVGDGRACYGHLLHEVQKASQTSMLLRLRVAFAMLDQGCREILSTSGPFTVLAPLVSSRTMNASVAQQLCRQHVIAGQHMLEEVGAQAPRRWWTLAGQEITVSFSRFRKYTYKYQDQPQQTFTIHKANYPAANGLFHVVTALRVQPPPELPEDPKRTIGQILASNEVFTRFETILENCGLPSFLDGPGPFTVFAPSNEAVDGLRDGRLVYLFTAGLSKLQELVRYHVYNHGQLTVEKLISKGRVLTMANQILAVNISEEGRILLGPEGVPLRRVDVLAANGVIHMLEGILLPPTILPILPKLCNEEQHAVVAGSCVDCQALNTSTCPPNSVKLDISPEECVYIHDPTGLNVLRKGCAHYCNQTIQKPGCCKGFFGPDCLQCPGGFSNPCYGKGNCSDGVQGSGACLCFPDYKGIACHICSNPNKHGEQCQEDCGCVHGLCDNRPGSGGVCQRGTCAPGFSGRFCNESTAECVPGARGAHHCTCHKGWSGDGRVCVAIDECELDSRGSCHADALCSYVGPGQSRCTCKLGFAGDGYMCSPIDPCRAGNGGCHDLATCRAVGGGQRVCTCPPGYGGDGFSCYGDILKVNGSLLSDRSPFVYSEELEANAHFSVFYQWVKGAGITFPADSQVTALVPSESAIRRLSSKDQAFWLQPRLLPQLVRAHFLQGALSEEELARLHGQNVSTLNPTVRWEIHNVSGRVWVQNASVDVADLLATNGVLHVLSQVLLPPRGDVPGGQGLLQQLDAVPAFHLFRELLQRHRLVPQIEAATAYTIFVPTNRSLEAQANSSSLVRSPGPGPPGVGQPPMPRPLSFSSSLQDSDVVRHHVILGEALSTEALGKGGHRSSLLGSAHWLVFYNHSGQPEVNHVPLEGPVLQAPGRSLFGLSGVLTVGSSRCLHSHAEALREKCVNCSRKFRCTQGYQLEDTPRKSCVYRSGYTFSRGCSYTCAKKIQVPDCCPGFFGTLCEPCPGGLGGVCSGHGQCQDRLLGSGECRCHEGFHGMACEMCELGRYGPNCTGAVDPCARDHGGCSPHANCTTVAPGQRTCTCLDGYTGDGELCQEANSCLIRHGGCHMHAECIPTGPQQNNGGCSPYAVCKSTGDGQRTCACDAVRTVGDGFTCRARVSLEYKDLKGDGPFTVFVPHADLMTNMSQDELARIRANRQLVFRYHVVGCRQLRSQELLEEGYATTLSGHPLRFSEREAGFTDREMTPALDAAWYQPGASPGLRTSECGPMSVGLPSALVLPTSSPETRPRPPGTWLHSSRAHPQGNIYINDFARVVSSDQEAVNGVLHFIDRVLLPPEALHWEADAAPAPRVGPSCGPGTLPPLLTSLLTEPLSPEKLHRCCRGLRLQDLQWPCDGTGPV
ncbi:hypothetical protein MG293_017619 [Ovis ammon polii]|uniref:Stabilin 1 n=1 Tax=Ovis ammon polii TaxID=230172 RepID=A0AAD4TU69_OVIAM|nr:hypothetical protein MG293_017619 [Ovis ammon polii]